MSSSFECVMLPLTGYTMSTRLYPLYQRGNPQLRVLLPNFWMKLIPPKHKLPPNTVQFIVSPEMTRFDVKQYLEKIYKVPVVDVRIANRLGKLFFRMVIYIVLCFQEELVVEG